METYCIILNFKQFIAFLPYKQCYPNVSVNYGYGYYTVIVKGGDALRTKRMIEKITKAEETLKRKREIAGLFDSYSSSGYGYN